MFQNDKKIIISVGSNRKATTWNAQELLWSDFVSKLRTPVKTPESFAEYKALTKARQDDLKDVGGFVGGCLKDGHRRNESAGERHIITLDADTMPAGYTQAVINAVDALGCAYVMYSTRKHEGAAPRVRVVVPLDIPVSPDEYEPIARKLAESIGMDIFDPTTFEPVRLMYWPSISNDSEYVYIYGDKPFLSKAGMLGMYRDWRNISEWPEVPGAAVLRNRSAKKQGNPLDKQGIVGAFCKTYDVETAIAEYLPGVYELCDIAPGRYTFLEGSTVGGAVLYDDGNFIFSHHATDPAGGKLCNAFDLVRLHKFSDEDYDAKPDTPVTQLPSFKAMCEFAVSIDQVSGLLNSERYEKAQEDFKSINIEGTDLNWMSHLQRSSKSGVPLKTTDNVLVILEHDPMLVGKFYHDEFANRVVVSAPLPWEFVDATTVYKERQWTDADDAGLRHYVEKVYNIAGKDKIYDALMIYANKHCRHKIREYLSSLVWDGKYRLDTLLVDYLGAADSAYTRAVTRKTLMAAVARIFHPGIKFDTMLIPAGAQGVGKSTFFRILGREWYSDSLSTFDGKDAAELIQGYWIIEAGELTGFNKSEMNTVKQFLSKVEDVYRAPYGRRTASFPRSCIIVGTTNDAEFLRDRTGNRRFWPVDLGYQVPLKNVFRDLALEADHIWAEAMVRYQTGESLFLEGAVADEAVRQQEEHKEISPKEGPIREFVAKKVPTDWNRRDLNSRRIFWSADQAGNGIVERDRICAAEIWCECFNGDIKMMRRADALEINGVLNCIAGWEKARGALKFGSYYGTQKGYVKKGNN